MLGILFFLVALSGGVVACSGGSTSIGAASDPGTTKGTYTVTITGTSGSITETGTITLTVQ
jgi:hypothetical protein